MGLVDTKLGGRHTQLMHLDRVMCIKFCKKVFGISITLMLLAGLMRWAGGRRRLGIRWEWGDSCATTTRCSRACSFEGRGILFCPWCPQSDRASCANSNAEVPLGTKPKSPYSHMGLLGRGGVPAQPANPAKPPAANPLGLAGCGGGGVWLQQNPAPGR